jgi:integrase/recombinase XerD
MTKFNVENERIKREYFDLLANRYTETSVDGVAKAIHRFETYTRFKPFKAFHIEQAKAFKRHLAEQVNVRTKQRLSLATIHSTLAALKKFFIWLAGRPGFKSRISYSDAEYFTLSDKESRMAKARVERPVPTPEQIRRVLECMPASTEIERRNRALVAFIYLTGARDSAVASLQLKHIHMVAGKVVQDGREVKTKFSKTFTTWFFPVGEDVVQIVADWVNFLTKEKLLGPEDPLFPATRLENGPDQRFRAAGLDRRPWSSAGQIRAIFKKAFVAAGLPYFNPHSFRNALALVGQSRCQTAEEVKAWSQNLGHESVLTTFTSYGTVPPDRQAEIIQRLGNCPETEVDIEDALRRVTAAARRR